MLIAVHAGCSRHTVLKNSFEHVLDIKNNTGRLLQVTGNHLEWENLFAPPERADREVMSLCCVINLCVSYWEVKISCGNSALFDAVAESL